jgi:thiol:disulfide interchange protein DsbA
MRRTLLLLAGLLCIATASAQSWTEGKNYFVIEPRQPTTVEPGKIEVLEVFSYGCPACNAFVPIAEKMKASLPPNAQMTFLPASFIPTENWPMFQRAYFAAKALGIADRTHNKMFDAVWGSGELAITDPKTNRLKKPLPSIEDAAKFYARVGGVKAEDFVAAAKSFSVEANMRRADMLIKDAYKVPSTPTIIVNGRYRLDGQSAGGYQQMIDLTNWLVAKETQARK